MKTLTPALLRFAVAALLSTVTFRLTLSLVLSGQHFNLVILLAVLYSLTMFLFGRYFGKQDSEYLPIFDIGFRFHLLTFLLFQVISYSWQMFGKPSIYEHISTLNMTLLIWGGFLLIHFFYYLQATKNTIKSIRKDDLFE